MPDSRLGGIPDDGRVRASGGVVVRRAPGHQLEVLLVHRPRYDDWTFPKGKRHGGESDEDTARREVEEETGYRCVLGPEVDRTDYVDAKGREKSVRYWWMEVVGGSFAPNDEVDVVAWLTPDAARTQLTYDRDREVLDRALRAVPE